MIPWRLRFTGIRDYTPTTIDFSDKNDHILISGPNGSGKSTITFCMGGVLYSSKVDVEGLRSNNLPTDKTWRAKIELLFKNDGDVKIDAPLFVQFRLDLEQKPGDPVKKEFFIEEGDRMDEWERTTKYSSGHFSEYKNQVLYKYAVDPDSFYLIWYQKEVNQFAIMHPEERFRIFSEMNGIDKIQKNWEQSKELVKETEQSLQEAESKQGINQMHLKQKKMELDRFHDRNRRLEEGFKQYYQGLNWLETHYNKHIETLKGQIEELNHTKEDKVEEKQSFKISQLELNENHKTLGNTIAELEGQEEELAGEIEQITLERKQLEEKRSVISDEIDDITKKVERIGMSEEKVRENLNKALEKVELLNRSIEEKEEHNKNLTKVLNELGEKIAVLQVEINQDKKKEKEVKELINTYVSSNAVQQEMNTNESIIDRHKDMVRQLSFKEDELVKEANRLKNNQVLSPRQEQSMEFFAKNNLEAFTLRELLELDTKAKQQDEKLFDTVKYTIFVNSKAFHVPNDLYHVPLPKIVPKQTISHMPDKHIKIKDELSDRIYPYAVKAMWWLNTFFEQDQPLIERGQLIDSRGIRGAQEDEEIILSEKVLQIRRKNVEEELVNVKENHSEITKEIQKLSNRNSTLFSRRESLKDAEAFLTKANEREWREKQYENLVEDKRQAEQEQQETEEHLNQLKRKIAEWKQKEETYQDYRKIYLQYQKEKDKIREVQLLKDNINRLQLRRKQKNAQLAELDETLDKKNREERQLERKLQDLNDKLSYQDREIDQIERQKEGKAEERVASEEAFYRTAQELHRLTESSERLVQQFGDELDDYPQMTKPQAEEIREQGKIIFSQAANETDIDEAAPENYNKMKEEYDQSADEVKKSKLLLEDYTERMEMLKEDLEDTINMKILGVNQKFIHYMSMFGFEGKIEWDMYTDKRGQVRYTLSIKARKEGHRGRLEDVSVKARGGKVGKGVSGGEESLSSLLFALALLQTIDASPGYIVLDEFDSALDEGRKEKVFQLYEQELRRKMIILTPKSHEAEYLYRFSKAYVVYHDPNIPKSKVIKVKRAAKELA